MRDNNLLTILKLIKKRSSTLCILICTLCMSSLSVANDVQFLASNLSISTTTNHRLQHPKIALVLGSGGARGYAHIGVIKVLEESGIKPDFIVGTSAGSIVGALYASGKSAQQIEDTAMALKPSDVRDFTLSKQGFFDGKKIEDYINKVINGTTLEHMPIPLYVVATELKSGQATVFKEGNTGKAVRASTSIPSMFVPTEIGNKEYVDGGLVSPVPVEIAKKLGADIVIAVDILARPEYTETTNIWGLFNQNINVMQNRLAAYEAQQADIVIRPDVREKQHVFSTKSRTNTIYAGEIAALSQIDDVKQLIEAKNITLNASQDLRQPKQSTVNMQSIRFISSK